MGLGKTLTCISLLHCILNNPLLTSTTGPKPAIRTALIVVPVNTIANWDAEFEMWTGSLHPSIRVINLGAVEATARRRNIRSWMSKGGVLLISDKTFLRVSKDFFEVRLISLGPLAVTSVTNIVISIFNPGTCIARSRCHRVGRSTRKLGGVQRGDRSDFAYESAC